MTTTATAASPEKHLATKSPPSLYNFQYPNCRRGMYSLRYPFKERKKSEAIPPIDPPILPRTSIVPQESIPLRASIPVMVQPMSAKVEHASPKRADSLRPLIVPRQVSKRNAHVQCSLLLPNIRHEMAVQTTIDQESSSDDDRSTPRFHSRRRLPPIQSPEEIYELWEVDSVRSLEVIPIDPPVRSLRHRRTATDYDEEMDSDDEHERLVYARPAMKKSHLPPNVRMLCIRDDENRTSH